MTMMTSEPCVINFEDFLKGEIENPSSPVLHRVTGSKSKNGTVNKADKDIVAPVNGSARKSLKLKKKHGNGKQAELKDEIIISTDDDEGSADVLVNSKKGGINHKKQPAKASNDKHQKGCKSVVSGTKPREKKETLSKKNLPSADKKKQKAKADSHSKAILVESSNNGRVNKKQKKPKKSDPDVIKTGGTSSKKKASGENVESAKTVKSPTHSFFQNRTSKAVAGTNSDKQTTTKAASCPTVKSNLKKQKPDNKRRRKESSDSDVVIVSASPVTKKQKVDGALKQITPAVVVAPPPPPTLPWTEKYQPQCADDVVGNKLQVQELFDHLLQWKKEYKERLRLAAMPQQNSDSDDDYNPFMSDDEESSSPNACVIYGPSGCGKTAAVHACAKELNIHVLEINASSLRGSKQIMDMLQEATQSHRISSLSSKPDKKSKTKKSLASNASYSIFKHLQTSQKTAAIKPSKPDFSDKMSLVLFDEVDAVLPQDKGFWHAVHWFFKQSKRPVIMTSTYEPALNQDARVFKIQFNMPNLNESRRLVNKVLKREKCNRDALTKEENHLLSFSDDVRSRLVNIHFWHCHTKKPSVSPAKSYSPGHDDLVLGVASYLKKRKLPKGATPMDAYLGLKQLSAKGYRNVEDLLTHLLFHNRNNYLWISPYLQMNSSSPAECAAPKKEPATEDSTHLEEKSPLLNGTLAYISLPETDLSDESNTKTNARIIKDLESWSSYHDCVSLCDVTSLITRKEASKELRFDSKKCCIRDGTSDESSFDLNADSSSTTLRTCYNIMTSLQLSNLKQFQSSIDDVTVTYEPLCPKNLQSPDTLDIRIPESDIASQMDYTLDYLPYLRAICHHEEKKRKNTSSRRYHHYLQTYISTTEIENLTAEYESSLTISSSTTANSQS